MKRKEFERCRIEDVGISAESVNELLNDLEKDYTQIHSLMILRHDKIAVEGWWYPYTSQLKHTMMSASKTFTGTAIGIAIREDLASLDEKIIDIFPEYIPADANENLKNVTVKDLLCMGSGSDHEVPVDKKWPYSLFHETQFIHEPGSSFLYNNAPANLLGLLIRKRSGLNLPEFLKDRLFDKIGIDYDNTAWFKGPDGTSFAPGGFHCTTEDLLRLMYLYLHKGNFMGEQILDEDYVSLATSKQIDTSDLFGGPPQRFSDNIYGYGFMMWMSHDDMGYRAEGAYGQFGIVIPKLDMIIAITQSSTESPVSQTTLDQIWNFVSKISDDPVERNDETYKKLKNRLERLCIRHDPCNSQGNIPQESQEYVTEGNGAKPYALFYDPLVYSYEADLMSGIRSFSFRKEGHSIKMHLILNDCIYDLLIPLDGTMALTHLTGMIYTDKVLLSAYFKENNTLCIRFRWIETCFTKELQFSFDEEGCTVSEEMVNGSDPQLETGIRYDMNKAV